MRHCSVLTSPTGARSAPRSQASIPGEQPVLHVGAARAAADSSRPRGRRAPRRTAPGRCGRRVLREQAGPEQQRVVGAEGDRHAGRPQPRDRGPTRGRAPRRARRWRPGRPRRRPGARPAAPAAPGPPPTAPRARAGGPRGPPPRRAPTRGPRSSPACGTATSPASRASRNALREVLHVALGLVVGQPEPDHPAPGEPPRQPGQGLRVAGVAGPVRGDDQRRPDAGAAVPAASASSSSSTVGLQPAQPGRVRRRVDLQLQPAGTGGGLVLDDLADDPPHLVRAGQHLAGRVVQPLEPRPPAPHGDVDPRPLRVEQPGRQRPALLGGQVEQGRGPHPAGEVQVQVRLGEQGQVTRRVPGKGLHPSSVPQSGSVGAGWQTGSRPRKRPMGPE